MMNDNNTSDRQVYCFLIKVLSFLMLGAVVIIYVVYNHNRKQDNAVVRLYSQLINNRQAPRSIIPDGRNGVVNGEKRCYYGP